MKWPSFPHPTAQWLCSWSQSRTNACGASPNASYFFGVESNQVGKAEARLTAHEVWNCVLHLLASSLGIEVSLELSTSK